MAHWDNREFEKQAETLAQAFVAGEGQNGADLKALATKIARESNLNAEQIRRLCRATNVAVFGKKFAQMKDAKAPDRIVEFDVVDPESVIHDLHKTATPSSEVAKTAALYPELPDHMRALRWAPMPAEKVASVEEDFNAIQKAIGKDPPAERQVMRLQKAAAEIDVQLKSAGLTWENAMRELGSHVKRIGFDHDTFEKSAVALYGVEVVPELNALRSSLKKADIELPSDEEKIAELLDRLVGSETAETRLLKLAYDRRVEYLQLQDKRNAVEQRRQRLLTEVHHG